MKKKRILLSFVGIMLFMTTQLENAYAEEDNGQITSHVVEKGETMWRIAKENHVSMEQIKEWNQLDSEEIYVGEVLKLAVSETTSTESTKNETDTKTDSADTSLYVVKAHETMWRIATSHNMTVDELMKLNDLTSINVYTGQTLKVSQTTTVQVPTTTAPVTSKDKVIALTFDDGPSSSVTPRVLSTLKANDVKATFFVLGSNAQVNPDLIRQEINEGHEIGNHSFSHPLLTDLSKEEADQQVASTNQIIQSITGQPVKLLRPPYGSINPDLMADYQMPVVEWSVDTEDWKSKNADAVYNEIVKNANSGAIVLMHDIHPTTADALPRVIQLLKSQGYRFVTVSELYNNQMMKNTSYYQKSDVR